MYSPTQKPHKKFLKKLLLGDHQECSKITYEFIDNNYSIEKLYETIFKEALYDIGILWGKQQN